MAETQTRNARKARVGTVVSDKMDKTIVVAIDRMIQHPMYDKYITRTSKLLAHDGENSAREGDTVRIVEARPMSKRKRWRLEEVVKRAE